MPMIGDNRVLAVLVDPPPNAMTVTHGIGGRAARARCLRLVTVAVAETARRLAGIRDRYLTRFVGALR